MYTKFFLTVKFVAHLLIRMLMQFSDDGGGSGHRSGDGGGRHNGDDEDRNGGNEPELPHNDDDVYKQSSVKRESIF